MLGTGNAWLLLLDLQLAMLLCTHYTWYIVQSGLSNHLPVHDQAVRRRD